MGDFPENGEVQIAHQAKVLAELACRPEFNLLYSGKGGRGNITQICPLTCVHSETHIVINTNSNNNSTFFKLQRERREMKCGAWL